MAPHKLLIDKLFNPADPANIQTADCMLDIILKIVKEFIKELHGPKQTVKAHLSSQNGELSWINSTKEERENGIGVHVVNDVFEPFFRVLTDELKSYENLGLTFAGGMVLCKKNGDFQTGLRKIGKYGKLMLYY